VFSEENITDVFCFSALYILVTFANFVFTKGLGIPMGIPAVREMCISPDESERTKTVCSLFIERRHQMATKNTAVVHNMPMPADTIYAWKLAKFLRENPELAEWICEKFKTTRGRNELEALIRIELKHE